jgi:tetratricopeptide (TPR) repeat protein
MNSLDQKAGRDDPRLHSLLQEAIDLKNQQDYAGAVRVLSALVRQYPKCAPAHGLLGSLYLLKLQQVKKAIACFKKTIKLAPKSEMASLGLFHSLWKVRKQTEALEEMKRFQTISHSKDYDEILAEIKEKRLCD